MVKQKLSKISYHIKKYGLFRTIKKMIGRLLGCHKKKEKKAKEIYQKWILQKEPSEETLLRQKKQRFAYEPKISIVVPMYNANENFFLELLNSVFAQTYSNWELCVADGSEMQNETIFAMCSRTSKIKYQFLGQNQGISENTNRALEMTEGDFIAFLDHDDKLPPFCLFELIKCINANPKAELLYSDEDKINEKGERFAPYFKPDFSPEMLECHNYITHFVVMKKRLVHQIGRLDSRLDGAQDFDFLLRAVEKTENIVHIPKILYHWRAHSNSTASVADAKNYAYEAGVKAIEAHLERMNQKAVVENPGEVPGIYQIRYEVSGTPKVSILLFDINHERAIKRCLKSILTLTTYPNYEILLLSQDCNDSKLQAFLEMMKDNPKIRLLELQGKTDHLSEALNVGIKQAEGTFVLCLNGHTKVLTSNWLELLLGYAQKQKIGAVGAKLYWPDRSIKQAGITYQKSGKIVPISAGLPFGEHGYFGEEVATRNVSAVTGDCLLARREVFEEVGYFDEKFKNQFYDVDFCLKVLEKGYRVVYNPYVELIWSDGKKTSTREKECICQANEEFQDKWKDFLKNKPDPYYNQKFLQYKTLK